MPSNEKYSVEEAVHLELDALVGNSMRPASGSGFSPPRGSSTIEVMRGNAITCTWVLGCAFEASGATHRNFVRQFSHAYSAGASPVLIICRGPV